MQMESKSNSDNSIFHDQETEVIRELENKIYDEITNGEGDYLHLPQYGAEYFRLSDAALIIAIDEWWQKSLQDEPDFFEGVCHPKARADSQPLKKMIAQALVRAVQIKDLDAIVCLRTLPGGEPSPDRTYALASNIQKYMESYGLGQGHLFEWAQQLDVEMFDLALAVSRRRAHIEHGVIPVVYETPTGPPHEVIQKLLKKIDSQKLRIAYLENRTVADDKNAFGERKRNNLYRTIGALLDLILPSYKDKQDALISDIAEKFGKQDGLSKRTLEAVFPLAK